LLVAEPHQRYYTSTEFDEEYLVSDYIKRQVEIRQRAWNEAKELLDQAAAEGRDLDALETEKYEKITTELEERARVIEQYRADEERELRLDAATREMADQVRSEPVVEVKEQRSDADIFRSLANGEIRSYEFRDLNTSDDSSVVPQSFYNIIQENMVTVGPMLDGEYVTLLNTASGEDIKVPVESTRPAATAIAEATAITPLDPTFASLTLKSQKVAVLTKVSRELLTDSGIDLTAFLGRSLGTALGIKVNSLLTIGTGTVQPNGIMNAAGSGVTGTATSTGVFTADDVIDLAHSVDSAYVRMGAVYMARRSTIGAIRKLRSADGAYLFAPAATVGSPDTLLSYPLIDNPDVAAVGSATKSLGFGWSGSYHVRTVGGIEIARSDDAFFNTDEVGFRATIRVWGDLGQSGAFKFLKG
jgi:HK97 family phage major capsid protein